MTEITEPSRLTIRHAEVADGARIWQLVTDCEVLDTNSCYAYLLLCRDFSSTTLVAEDEGAIQAFVTAYLPPNRQDTIFVWQIGASASVRRRGLGKSLLRALLQGDACRDVQYLEATITPSNTASLRLFRSLAEELGVEFRTLSGFGSGDFDPRQECSTQHEPEDLVRIGPLRSIDANV